MMAMRKSPWLIILSCLLIAACGARFGAGKSRRSIDYLRQKAADRPNDVGLWSELAIAEHVEDGGDPKKAREALDHAHKLGAKSLALSFVEAEEHVLEGRSSKALDTYLGLLAASAGSDDEDR